MQSDYKVPELLAPVGGMEQFFAALNCGADAVFLGLKVFNARARATNFSFAELREILPIARNANMKVLVTLNILVKQSELSSLITTLAFLEELEVDAVIVQDLGVLRIIQQSFPSIRAHASTQLAVHNCFGAIEAYKLGFKRIVLARELTKQEIKNISLKLNLVSHSEAETEAFCHGSLCYSYSGLCFFSGSKDARSGNRGECAYTCRQPYKIINEPGSGFLFSMKDLSTADNIQDLAQTGVHTLKIEGRKKDAQYVSTVVSFYRQKLNDFAGFETGNNKNSAFRSQLLENRGFAFKRQETTLFLNGRYKENVIDLNHTTHNGESIGVVSSINFNALSGLWQVGVQQITKNIRLRDGIKIIHQVNVYRVKPQHGAQSPEMINQSQQNLSRRFHNQEVQFSLQGLKNAQKNNINEALLGESVTFETAENLTGVEVGAEVFKVRSSQLKELVGQVTAYPHRIRGFTMLGLEVSVERISLEKIKIKILLKKLNTFLVCSEREVSYEVSERKLEDIIQQEFRVFGDAECYCKEFSFKFHEENFYVPKKILKEMKKELSSNLQNKIDGLRNQKIKEALDKIMPIHKEFYQHKQEYWCVKLDRFELASDLLNKKNSILANLKEIIIEPKKAFLKKEFSVDLFKRHAQDISFACAQAGVTLRFAFPTVIRAWDEPVLKKWFEAFWQYGVRSFEVGNIGALGYLRAWVLEQTNISWDSNLSSLDISADFCMYSINSQAVEQNYALGCKTQALSVELESSDVEHLLANYPKHVVPQSIIYKDTPLFIAESCSLTALHNGCPTAAVCGYRTLEIENEKKEKFFVAHESCKSIVYAQEAYSLCAQVNELRALGVSNFRADFLTREYSADKVVQILNDCFNSLKIAQTHTANFEKAFI
jgi:U32 family peptidase